VFLVLCVAAVILSSSKQQQKPWFMSVSQSVGAVSLCTPPRHTQGTAVVNATLPLYHRGGGGRLLYPLKTTLGEPHNRSGLTAETDLVPLKGFTSPERPAHRSVNKWTALSRLSCLYYSNRYEFAQAYELCPV